MPPTPRSSRLPPDEAFDSEPPRSGRGVLQNTVPVPRTRLRILRVCGASNGLLFRRTSSDQRPKGKAELFKEGSTAAIRGALKMTRAACHFWGAINRALLNQTEEP